jgi:hypothetical protein
VNIALWLLPALITMAGLVPIAVFLRRLNDEAGRLQDSVARFGDLRPALVELRTDLRRSRDVWEQLGRR